MPSKVKAPTTAGPVPKGAKTDVREEVEAVVALLNDYFTRQVDVVFLDGKRLDEVVGRASFKLAPGTYRLLFQHPAGEKRFDTTRNVVVDTVGSPLATG